MGDLNTMMLALAVEPMGGGDWRWCWYDHDSGKALADGVEGSERAAWTEATSHYVKNSDVVVRSVVARAEAAEQRAEALAAEVARLRADWAVAVAEVAEMGAEPDTTGQVLTERRSPATRAALREVARMLAEAQPAEVPNG